MDILFILVSFAAVSLVVMLLVVAIVFASKSLLPGGSVKIEINDGERELEVSPGTSLLSVLGENDIYLPSACGGGGTCAMCKCKVSEGGGELLPTESGQITRREALDGYRLSCQLKVKNDLKIEIPPDILEVKKFEGTVVSNHNVATFIKELTIKLPPEVEIDFRAGGYIQIDVPEYELSFSEFDIADEYHPDWEKYQLFEIAARSDEPCFRAYSMASYPAERDIIILNVRIATPPPGANVPPGVASSYIFNLKPGDKVVMSGPFGEFYARDTEREMVYVGGGAGMAPMRSHIFDLLKTKNSKRKISYWYGARSRREMFYDDEFKELEQKHPNFSYHVALSEPLPEDEWDGPVGFIHKVLLDEYLDQHPDPQEIEYYLCGPPPMIAAVKKMLHDLGVEPEMISYDEFS
jgi:Na+-transporting NADH:ubiquinone oxidoreductase subunit F